MRKGFSRVLSLCLATCLLATLLPSVAQAAETSATYILPPSLELSEVTEFHDGVAAVEQGGKWAYINSKGKLLTPFEYDFAAIFNEGKGVCAIVTEEDRARLSHEGIKQGDERYDPSMYLYYVDTTGTQHAIPDSDGDANKPAQVAYSELNQSKTLFVNGYIPFGYRYVSPDNKLHSTGNYHDDNFDSLGLITTYPMTEGAMGCIVEAIGWHPTVYMGGDGELALNPMLPETYGPVLPDKSADWQGTGTLLHQSYRQVEKIRPFNQGVAPAYQTTYDLEKDTAVGGWGFIDTTGKFVIPAQYRDFMVTDENVTYRIFNEGVAMVKNADGAWGGIDNAGKMVIPFQYEMASAIFEGIVSVQKDGKWGGVDATGKTVVPFSYDSTFFFHEGLARVESGGKFGFVNTAGKLVIPCVYDNADRGCYEGLVWVAQNGKSGYLDATGAVVLPLTFQKAYRFYDGVAFVQSANGKYGIIANPLKASDVTTNQSRLELMGWTNHGTGSGSLHYQVTNTGEKTDQGIYAMVFVKSEVQILPMDYSLTPGQSYSGSIDTFNMTPDTPTSEEFTSELPGTYVMVVKFSSYAERDSFMAGVPWVKETDYGGYFEGLAWRSFLDPYEKGDQWLAENFGGAKRTFPVHDYRND